MTLVVLLLAGGCRDRSTNTLRIVVSLREEPPPIVRLEVALSTADMVATVTVTGSESAPVVFPATVGLSVAGLPRGAAILKAAAYDASDTPVALGNVTVSLPFDGPLAVELTCQSSRCSTLARDASPEEPADAGAPPDGPGIDSVSMVESTCGNGRLDFGEVCDTRLTPELPGACPANCDDGIACTRDRRRGEACGASCEYEEITTPQVGDGCCPSGADHASDPDCSTSCGNMVVDPGESCDSAIATGPGWCPTAPSCDDGDPCTRDELISAKTCSARCVHRIIAAASPGDRCCPLRADATTDPDCRAVCGNGAVEPGERCDVRIPAGREGACPSVADCDDDNACTRDLVVGSGCQAICGHRIIDVPISGDGCCPAAAVARNVDSDCRAVCGNGVVEAGETCDLALAAPAAGSCLSSCPASNVACVRFVMHGTASTCSAACVPTAAGLCAPTSDGCCPSGCTAPMDPDCSTTCGNGRVDPGETCDTAIPSGAGACPRSCADGIPCTDDLLIDADTCNARCAFVATTTLRNGDACCPPGAHAGIDADCPATCGNGVVETPWESCDTSSAPVSCPATCPPDDTCGSWTRTGTAPCDVRCVRHPITTCTGGDGCCAPGCNASNDSDCLPRCGNGVVEATETCDRGITAGHAGACQSSCADADPCTLDITRGDVESCSRTCSHPKITACGGGDRCCPAGCSAATDGDCSAMCANGVVEAGETCDPESTCLTGCASDGDSCTVEQLVFVPGTCNATCTHVPILRCSGTQRDGCCPTQCSATSDADC